MVQKITINIYKFICRDLHLCENLASRSGFNFKEVKQSNLGSRTPRIMNNSVYEQIFRTQSVSDDVLCLKL
jgi:hypothetical protein